jgi:hypothetical protein
MVTMSLGLICLTLLKANAINGEMCLVRWLLRLIGRSVRRERGWGNPEVNNE